MSSPREKRSREEYDSESDDNESDEDKKRYKRTSIIDVGTPAIDASVETGSVLKPTPQALVNVFVTPKIAAPQNKLDFKIIQSGYKDAYSLLTPHNQIARNMEICKQIRDAISKTFTMPNYTNDSSFFGPILDSIPHNDMLTVTDFYKAVGTCLNPDLFYKTDLEQLGDNDQKNLFIQEFRAYVQSLITPGQKSSEFNLNEESQVDPLLYKPDVIISASKSVKSFHPGASLIYKGTEINYGMSSLFTTRIKSFFGGDITFNTLTLSILSLFKSKDEISFKVQLANAYTANPALYNLAKFYIDAGDLIHDINKRRTDNLNNNNYYTGLITIGNQLGQQNVSTELDKCFTSSDVNNIKTVSQEKTRKVRSDALDLIFQTNSTVNTLIPKLKTIDLTQETGYFELIKQINIIYVGMYGENIKKFIYRESGRKLQISGIVDYYNALSNDTKPIFIQKCVDYCDNSNVTADYLQNIMTPPPPDLQVDLKSITSFDGCGTTKGLSHDKINIATFEYVFGFFKYVVYTVFDTTNNEFNHLVIVTSYIEPLKPLAVFGFVGNITINMLLGVEGIPATREGSGEKGGLKSINAICSILTKDVSWKSIVLDRQGGNPLPPNWVVPIDANLSIYYNESIPLNSGVRQLLFLGNKTIGDLIVTTYDDVKTVTTVDSLIADSTMYNFLAGKSEVLQSVWRQTGSKGWVFTPGMFKANLTTKSNYIAIQMLGSLMLLQVVLTPGLSNDSKPEPVWQPLVIAYINIINTICSNCITNNLRILTRFRVLLNYTFVDFSNHITNSYVDTPSVYNECMLQLLIIENKVIQTRVKNYINTVATYITNHASLANTDDDKIEFLNHIYLLPNVETLFFSNMSNIASNNQEAYDLPGLIEKIVPVNEITISSINTKSIIFGYNSKSKFTDQSYFKKNLITPEELLLADPTKPGSDRRDPTWTYNFTIPYTIESLINLFGTDKLDDTTKLDVANRIVMFFKNNISAIGINDVSADKNVIDALQTITQTLIKSKIMAQNTTLSSYESTFAEEDNAECGLECGAVDCSITDDNTNNNWNVDNKLVDQVPIVDQSPMVPMELGGTLKTTRKKRKPKQKRKTKGGKKPGKNKTKKQRKKKKNNKTRSNK
jgi:hypothetical protein